MTLFTRHSSLVTCHSLVVLCLFIYTLAGPLCSALPYSSQEAVPWIDGTHELVARFSQLIHVSETAAPERAHSLQHPQVGDQRKFYAMDFSLSGSPYFVNATCRAVGEFCYIFVEDSQWDRGIVTNTDVVKLRRAFDDSTPRDPSRGIYELETTNLGPTPDEIDLDPKIYILVLDILDDYDRFGTYVAGYFEPLNQKRGVFRDPNTGMKLYSNEVELIYIDSHPLDAGSAMAREILAHELQHLIHWRHDPDEDIWINEGCSVFAASFLCRYEIEHPWLIEAFESDSQVSLVYWASGVGSPLANYSAAYLWMVYLYEQYGGISTISSLIAEPDNGIKGINDVLSARGYSQDFDDVFSDWKIANFLDDTSFASGNYGYNSLDLRIKPVNRHFSLPVSNISRFVRSWAADYIEFSGGDAGADLQIDFAARNPNYDFDVRVITMKNGVPLAVESIYLEDIGTGHIPISDFGYAVDTVVLVPSWKAERADFGDSVSYSYSARLGEAISFDVVVLPNAVHERYLDFVVQFNQNVGSGIPQITVTGPGKIIVKEKMSQVLLEKDRYAYVYQLYVPHGWDSSEIKWDISYQGRFMSGGDLGSVLSGNVEAKD